MVAGERIRWRPGRRAPLRVCDLAELHRHLVTGIWIFEIDADERVPTTLGLEIKNVVTKSRFDWHEIPVDNFIGKRLVRYGWGASFGKSAYPGLFRKGTKKWGVQRVHPTLYWTGKKGPRLKNRLIH